MRLINALPLFSSWLYISAAEARRMADSELRDLGLSHLAYFRTACYEGKSRVSIHAADGTPLAIAEDKKSALNAILEQEMIPVSVQ